MLMAGRATKKSNKRKLSSDLETSYCAFKNNILKHTVKRKVLKKRWSYPFANCYDAPQLNKKTVPSVLDTAFIEPTTATSSDEENAQDSIVHPSSQPSQRVAAPLAPLAPSQPSQQAAVPLIPQKVNQPILSLYPNLNKCQDEKDEIVIKTPPWRKPLKRLTQSATK